MTSKPLPPDEALAAWRKWLDEHPDDPALIEGAKRLGAILSPRVAPEADDE